MRKLLTFQQSYSMWPRIMFNLDLETRRKSTMSYIHVSKTIRNVWQKVAPIKTQSLRFKEQALKMLCAKYHLKMSTMYRDTQSWWSKWSAMGNDPVMITWLFTKWTVVKLGIDWVFNRKENYSQLKYAVSVGTKVSYSFSNNLTANLFVETRKVASTGFGLGGGFGIGYLLKKRDSEEVIPDVVPPIDMN